MRNAIDNKPIYILGYSGLNNSIEFKQKEFPGFSREEIRISQGMDAAAALICDGGVVSAAAEERYNLQKHSHKFPINAMRFCLQKAGIDISDVDFITHGFDYHPYNDFYKFSDFNRRRYEEVFSPDVQLELFAEYFNTDLKEVFTPVPHHHAHAASAYYPSGFNNALVVVVDGLGEMHSISIFSAEKSKLKLLRQYDILSSLGIFYSIITYFLGFSVNSDEYKIMGLAPYGNYKKYLSTLSECIKFNPKGETFIPLLLQNRTLVEKESYRGAIKWLSENLFPQRNPLDRIGQEHKDLAATLQYLLNKAMLHIVSYWQQETQHDKLCMAGGVALNCTANGEILKNGIFDDIYIQPAAGDDGTSVGSALYQHYSNYPEAKRKNEKMPFYGYSATRSEISKALIKFNNKIKAKRYKTEKLLDEVTELILRGEVIAWMQGEMEFGPRALGHRSILADPRSSKMKDIINQLVKKRESFRPFAPAVKHKDANKYFDFEYVRSLPYMLFVVPVKEEYRDKLPAITHINGSARIQTVNKEDNYLFWKLIDMFGKKSGIPILLNTSFNVKGQPIVCTAEDAITTFLSTGINVLVIDNYIILRITKNKDQSK